MRLMRLQTILILALIIGMSGCGFKLRGTGEPLPMEIRQLTLMGIDKDSDFYQELARALIAAGATLDGGEQDAQLTIHQVTQTRDEISVSGGQTLYRTNVMVKFSLLGGEQESVIDSRQLRATREFSFDSNNPYGLEQQELTLRKELQRELIQQLIQQARAAAIAKAKQQGTPR